MVFIDYFRPVATWTPERLRHFLDEHEPGDYNLIDVRQPAEYARGHLPGAVLIPVGELEHRPHGMNPMKPTVTY